MVWGLVKRKWQILLVACAVTVPVGVATMLAERLYRASAMVQVDPEPVQVLPYREIDVPSLTPNYDMFMKSQEQILRGTALQARVASHLRGDEGGDAEQLRAELDPLGSRLWLQRIENTQMFRLGYVAPRPEVAAKVANIYAEEYLKFHFDQRQQTREKARQQLEAELHALEAHVRTSDRELVTYAQAHGIPTAENAQSLIQEKLAALSKQLTDTEGEAFAASARLEALSGSSVDRFPERLMTGGIQGLTSQLTTLEHDRTALRATFGPNWPAVAQKEKELVLVQEQLAREKAAALDQARQQATLDVRSVDNKRRMLAASTAEQQQLANKLENASIQYDIIKGEAEKNRKLYDGVLEQLKKTSISSGMEFGGFRVVEQAVVPTTVYSPRPLWNLSLAAVLGLALGVTIALARNYWDTSITSVEDIEQLDMLPVLGTLLLARSTAEPGGLIARARLLLPGSAPETERARVTREAPEPRDPRAAAIDLAENPMVTEDVRTICASLLLSRAQRPPRVLLVTSAAPGEGKTTLATVLAEGLASTGASTLLVDCDVRRGRLAKVFNIESDGGLTLYLAGHSADAPRVHATSKANLFVVTAGPAAPNPPALLGSERMTAFVQSMLASHQFVILDAPPVIPLADARVLAHSAEGVILVVRAGRVPKTVIRRACALLESAGATILGTVLNGVDDSSPASAYRYYHHYHDHQPN